MENNGINYSQDMRMQQMLKNFLPVRSSIKALEAFVETHPDDDSLTAFVEGNLTSRETQPLVKHLVDCSFCRHITAELIKLDYAFAEIEETKPANIKKEAEPTKISEVLSGLLSRIFGTNDGAVFAHNESEEDSENDSENSENPKENSK